MLLLRKNMEIKIKDCPMRTGYAATVETYVEKLSVNVKQERTEILQLPEKERREKLKELLGWPLTEKREWVAVLVKTERIFADDFYVATRYVFDIEGIAFGGILYEKADCAMRIDDAFFFALHGGAGSAEIVGDLGVDSGNYNHMVKRLLRRGVRVFAPQLLLWDSNIYGSPYDREHLNRRLLQLGGSMTALECKCLMALTKYWASTCDESRMGVVGLSYGGMYALHFGALEPKLKAVYSSCWFNNRAKYNWHDWTYWNAERKFFDAEIASLVLPRALFIEVGERDKLFPAIDAEEEKIRLTLYAKKASCEKRLHFKSFDGTHELDKDDTMLQEFVQYVIIK